MNIISLFISHVLLLKLFTFLLSKVPCSSDRIHLYTLYFQGPAPEPDQQELDLPKTGRERGDGPDVRGRTLENLEPEPDMPEAGM